MTPLARDIRIICHDLPGDWEELGDGNCQIIGAYTVLVREHNRFIRVSVTFNDINSTVVTPFFRELSPHRIVKNEQGKQERFDGDPHVWLRDAVREALDWAKAKDEADADEDGFDVNFWTD